MHQDCDNRGGACNTCRQSPTEPVDGETLTFTTAPIDYDWGSTRQLDVVGKDKRGRDVRRVATPSNRVEAQRGRYGSGLHMAVDLNEWLKLVDFNLVEVSK